MVSKKFCLVGIDVDFEDLIEDHKNNYLGYFSSKKTKSYKKETGNLLRQKGGRTSEELKEEQI